MTSKSGTDLRREAQEWLARLRTERDEIQLKLHLGKAEARAEWERLEPKWEHFKAKADAVADSAGETSQDVGAALGLMVEELRHGYERLRDALRS